MLWQIFFLCYPMGSVAASN